MSPQLRVLAPDEAQAWDIIGGLSKPSKMPGWAYGLPAQECITGSELAKIPGTTCHGCYALKGNYAFSKSGKTQSSVRLTPEETSVGPAGPAGPLK